MMAPAIHPSERPSAWPMPTKAMPPFQCHGFPWPKTTPHTTHAANRKMLGCSHHAVMDEGWDDAGQHPWERAYEEQKIKMASVAVPMLCAMASRI